MPFFRRGAGCVWFSLSLFGFRSEHFQLAKVHEQLMSKQPQLERQVKYAKSWELYKKIQSHTAMPLFVFWFIELGLVPLAMRFASSRSRG